MTYAWKADYEFADQTCSVRITYQAYGNLLQDPTSNQHHIVIRDPIQKVDYVLNIIHVETGRGNHWNLSAVMGQPAIRISYDVVDLEKIKGVNTLQRYTGYKAILFTDVMIINKKHKLAYPWSSHQHFQWLENLVYHQPCQYNCKKSANQKE